MTWFGEGTRAGFAGSGGGGGGGASGALPRYSASDVIPVPAAGQTMLFLYLLAGHDILARIDDAGRITLHLPEGIGVQRIRGALAANGNTPILHTQGSGIYTAFSPMVVQQGDPSAGALNARVMGALFSAAGAGAGFATADFSASPPAPGGTIQRARTTWLMATIALPGTYLGDSGMLGLTDAILGPPADPDGPPVPAAAHNVFGWCYRASDAADEFSLSRHGGSGGAPARTVISGARNGTNIVSVFYGWHAADNGVGSGLMYSDFYDLEAGVWRSAGASYDADLPARDANMHIQLACNSQTRDAGAPDNIARILVLEYDGFQLIG